MSAIKFSIGSLCNVCLSVDRKLQHIRNFPETIEWINIGLQIEDAVVCWECLAIMRKYILFKKKVENAQTILYTNHLMTDIKSFSTLSTHNNKPTDFEISYVEATIKINQVDIKIEPTDSPSNKETGGLDFETGGQDYQIGGLDFETVGQDFETGRLDFETGGLDFETDRLNYETDEQNKEYNETELNVHDSGGQGEDIFDLGKKVDEAACADIEISKDNKVLYSKKYTSMPISLEELQHIREKERGYSKFQKAASKCSSCVIVFCQKKELEQHNDMFHKRIIGEHICNICECRFNTPESLRRHLSSHETQYSCELCPYRHYSVDNMEDHMRRNHDKDNYRCYKCEMDFCSKRSQKNHMYTAHSEPCTCDICGKIMKSRINLKQHIRITHEQEIFDCKFCEKKFRGRKKLQYHLLSHSSREKDLSYCPECDIQFDNRYKYRVHLKGNKHLQPESECQYCRKKFVNRQYVERHIAIVHMNKLDYNCDKCDKKFSTSSNLKKHLITKHEGKQADRKHICNICSKSFTTKHGLKGHLNRHTGERPFKCDHCEKSFAQNGGLYKHRQRVHKVGRLKDIPKEIIIENT